MQPNPPYPGTTNLYRGGSGGGAGEGATASTGAGNFSDAGDGMAYNIADGSTPIVYAGGGTGGNVDNYRFNTEQWWWWKRWRIYG